MNTAKNQQIKESQETNNATVKKANNPFENHQSVEQDVQRSRDELEKEQQFKEAQTERD